MSGKTVCFILFTLCTVAFVFSVCRDIRTEEHSYRSDLRNRVVGARLIRDGRSPYFYKWDKKDGVRYYDPDNNDPDKSEEGRLSTITATPFFHHLLYPITEWPQVRIFRLWLVLEYIVFIGMTVYFLLLARTPIQRAAVLIVAILFMLTEAWYIHIYYGQYYLFIPVLATLFYWLVQNHKNLLMAGLAGLVAITLVLIRPNFLLFFLPFLLLWGKFTRYYLIVLFIPVLGLSIWSLADKNESGLWKDYKQAVGQHTASHMQGHPFINSASGPAFSDWEGIKSDRLPQPEIKNGENETGNFFLLLRRYYKPGIGLVPLQILSLCMILGLLGAFFLRHRVTGDYPVVQVAILGYCLYMISDLFSPIYRWQYYTLQWVFPFLLTAAVYDRRDKWAFLLLLAGLGLNIINIGRINIEHSLGEYLMLAVLISLSFSRKPAKNGVSAV